MANVSKEKKDRVKELFAETRDVSYIHDLTGLQRETIERILGIFEVKETEEEPEEEETDIESAEFWKEWSEFWKGKYLEEHAKVIILEA